MKEVDVYIMGYSIQSHKKLNTDHSGGNVIYPHCVNFTYLNNAVFIPYTPFFPECKLSA